jgi:[acyl-carrier-protein] S-malonyltransferase
MKAMFVFSGQGAQRVGMGRDLYEASPAAKAVFDAADQVLGWSVSEVCFEDKEGRQARSMYVQPAIYTMSCAALEAYREKHPEIQPVACAGLSLGEYGALYAGSAFSFVNGLKLVARRAGLMDEACAKTDGGMASVLGGDAGVIGEVCAACDIDVANFNSPGQIVISGEKAKVAEAVAILKEKGMGKVIPLNVAGAYHSRLMKDAGSALHRVLEKNGITMPAIPVYHNFTARPAKDLAELIGNLEKQVAGSVRWMECVQNMIAAGADTMIEFGPGNVLTGLLKRTAPDVPGININNVDGLDQ